MSENRAQLLKIVQRYLAGEATAEERRFLETYYNFWGHEKDVLDQLLTEEKKLLEERMQANILAGIAPKAIVKVRRLWPASFKVTAAAAILVFCLVGTYLVFHKEDRKQIAVQKDILPGSNKVMLTLAGGQIINLDDAKSGELAKQAGIAISKSQSGELIYTITKDNPSGADSSTNKIETPKGRQYQVILPDGTHVWLNASSSLTYPVSFTGVTRKVSLKGEGYFEVAGNAKKPFKVEIDGQTEVKVLGTHFNINAYPEEPAMRTTLLEGAVSLRSNDHSATLAPGQQAQVNNIGKGINVIDNVDLDQAIAWKNGFFSVNSASLDMIMKQVERWYDVKVVYKEDVQAEFVARLPRDLPLSKLLHLLELTKQVHFKVEGNIIEVLK